MRIASALIRRFSGNWCLFGLLWPVLRACERSVNSDKSGRLKPWGLEIEGKRASEGRNFGSPLPPRATRVTFASGAFLFFEVRRHTTDACCCWVSILSSNPLQRVCAFLLCKNASEIDGAHSSGMISLVCVRTLSCGPERTCRRLSSTRVALHTPQHSAHHTPHPTPHTNHKLLVWCGTLTRCVLS